MSNFTVDAISHQRDEMQEQESSKKDMANMKKSMQKEQESNIKRLARESERQSKMAEQRQARILLMKVERRFNAFPWLREKVPPIAKNASLGELQETSELQQLELELQGAEKRLHNYIAKGSLILESIWGDGSKMTFLPEQMRFNLKNLGMVMNSPMFLKEAGPLISETIIEYPTFGQMSLQMRWAECIFNTMIMVHQMNSNPRLMEIMTKRMAESEEFDSEEEGGFESQEDEAPARKADNQK